MTNNNEYDKVLRESTNAYPNVFNDKVDKERLGTFGITSEEYIQRERKAKEMLETGKVDWNYILDKARVN